MAKYAGQLEAGDERFTYRAQVATLGLGWILAAWDDLENKYDRAEIRQELINWLSHLSAWEFALSQWEGVRIAGTFPARKFDASRQLQSILAQQARIYVLIRAVGYTDAEAGTIFQASKAVAAERSYQERRKYFVLRKKRAKVVGKGASGRSVTRCKSAYVKQVDNGSRVATVTPPKPAPKVKASVEDLNQLVKKIRGGGG